MLISCTCGQVEIDIEGVPVLVSACHCDDCQEGWGRIQDLENAPQVVDERGGTEFVFYMREQVSVIQGDALLQAHKLKPESPTSRVAAGCCNTALYSERQGTPYLAVVRARLGAEAPPLEMRHFTKFALQQPFNPGDLPAYSGVPARMIFKLLRAWLLRPLRRLG